MEYTIYSITCIDEKVKGIYVGSTKDFANRQRDHKLDSKNEKKTNKLYRCINSDGGISNWEFKILELFTCETQTEAFIKERLWYDELGANLNTIKPHATKEEKKEKALEYQRQHKEERSEKGKQWYIENKYKRLELGKQYRSDNREILNNKTIESRRKYTVEKKEMILEQCKQYRSENQERIKKYCLENKERIKQQMSEKIYCPQCDSYHRRGEKSRHCKSQKHIDNIANFTGL